ncbi:MAG: peptidylprolyl isomerase [Verrucomicrobiaceae bacterium]|nr:peptidylprolyl isomerase [Verrucomicrobiaceae bacterium]
MKSLPRLLCLVLAAACSHTIAQEKKDPYADAAARAADARKAAESSDPKITETVGKTPGKPAAKSSSSAKPQGSSLGSSLTSGKKGSTKSKVKNPDDPTTWGKSEVHKLAVMDIKYGGDLREVVFELFPNDAPRTVSNFADNCAAGAYNGLAVHRAIDGYLVQTGDPSTSDASARDRWGTGGEDKLISAEIKRPHKLGAVAMARRSDRVNPEKKSNGFQFYFALGNMAALDGQYTVFGQVVSGLEWIERISRVPADSNDCPLERIEVKSIKVVDQTGPLTVLQNSSTGKRRLTRPDAAKGKIERFIERIW